MSRRRIRKKRLLIISLVFIAIIALAIKTCMPEIKERIAEASKPKEIEYVHLNDTLLNSMSDKANLADMNHEIERYLERWELNGAQLAISRNDSLLYVRGFGWADKEKNLDMQPGHIMRVASVSKLITAIGIMKLVDSGKLKLSDHVFGANGILNDTAYTNRIKDPRYFDITVEQLLRHKAGFNNRQGDPMFSTRYIMMGNHLTKAPDNKELTKILLSRRLGYTPGQGKMYSNVGYMLLSSIIARKTGMSYEAFMRDSIFAPAGCFDFHIAGNYLTDRRKNEVKYYMHKGSEPVPEFNNSGRMVEKCYGENDIPRLLGAGAWSCSAAELSRLIASVDLLPGIPDILSEKSLKLMTTEMPNSDFSLGWNFTPNDSPWIRTGTLSGTSAIVLRYPDGETWILLTNTSTWKGHGFSKDTIGLFKRLRSKYSNLLPKQNLFFTKKNV